MASYAAKRVNPSFFALPLMERLHRQESHLTNEGAPLASFFADLGPETDNVICLPYRGS